MINHPYSSMDDLYVMMNAQKRGEARGFYSVCSANQTVLEASIRQVLEDSTCLVVESTCNQVNQYGGYTGMTPRQFAGHLQALAQCAGLSEKQWMLGGDHLGPGPWQHEPAQHAMLKAEKLMADCVQAGYSKLHLDASMHCADDDPRRPLAKEVSAKRAARLCLAAERALENSDGADLVLPVYVIGTEVPPPGGEQDDQAHVSVTKVEEAQETIELTREAFRKLGLEEAWERVVAVVVQPGVEFGNQVIHEYEHSAACRLSELIEAYDHLVYEAHSTDYQHRTKLKEMVEDHFAFLKVGPALTFAFREAVMALEHIEKELLGSREDVRLSGVMSHLEAVMFSQPEHWQRYYQGDEAQKRILCRFSYSDRSRYYWVHTDVQRAVRQLITNLSRETIPMSLLSQYMPGAYLKIREGALLNTVEDLIQSKIRDILTDYRFACGLLNY